MRRLNGLLLLALATQEVDALRPAHSLGRRALLFGAASSLTANLQPQPASATKEADLDAIVQRAKTSSLTTDNVIIRAMNDDLIEVNPGTRVVERVKQHALLNRRQGHDGFHPPLRCQQVDLCL